MKTADTIILHPSPDKFEALMAFVKALKIDFEIPKTKPSKTKLSSNSISNEKAILMEEIKDAVQELTLIRQGKLKGISAKDLLNEL
jgi:hypothetical protein